MNTPTGVNDMDKEVGKDTCVWQEDCESTWDTSCDTAFVMIDGTPTDNEYKFCPSCGKSIKEVRYVEAD